MLGAQLGQVVGVQFGSFLGRQIALGACRDDRDDDLERRPFVSRVPSHAMPPAVDLRSWMSPVEDQGALGSCTANALVGALEYLARRQSGEHVDLSRLFVYFNQRLWDDCVRDDVGASVSDGIRVVSRVGVPREASWPYARELFAVQPTEAVYREAARMKAHDWWSIPVDGDALRGCLAAGFPIVFGTRVTESFIHTPENGLCGMPRGADDRRHGRHALLLVGYDDRHRLFVVRNSWGSDWGDRGYVYMPYDYVLNRNWTSGCWAVRLTDHDAFDPSEHAAVDLRSIPSAPPGGSKAAIAGGVAATGATAIVGALTGSGLLAGLAGGLIAGVTPGIASRISKDRGAFVDRDRADEILAMMRGTSAPPPGLVHLPWDDGLDEAAAVSGIGRTRHEPSSRRSSSKSREPSVAPAIAAHTPSISAAKPNPIMAALPDPALIDMLPEHIAAWWRCDGGAKGPLGPPIAAPAPMNEGAYRGIAVRFADGAMFAWDPPPGAPRLAPITLLSRERAFARWIELGAGHGAIGWPVGPIEDARGARILKCTRGTIVDHPEHGVHPIHGALFAYWQQLGGFLSDLGHPIADPVVPSDPNGEQTLRFERGTLCWSPTAGARRT